MINPAWRFLILFMLILDPATGGAQITVDGSLAEGEYQSVATKLNANSGFGPNIDVAEIVYYPDTAGSVLYLGVQSVLDTGSSDGMGLWINLSGQSGAASGSGTNTGLELALDFDAIGADSSQDLEVFTFVVSQTAFFSDVTVPGNLSPGNPGFNVDFALGDVNGDMTPDAAPWHGGPQSLPVRIQAFSIEP